MITRKKYSKKKNFTLKKGRSGSSPRIGMRRRRRDDFVNEREAKRTASSNLNDYPTYKQRQKDAELKFIDRLAQARNKSPQRSSFLNSPRRNLQSPKSPKSPSPKSPKSRPQPDESAGRKTLLRKQNQSPSRPPRPPSAIDVRKDFRQRSDSKPNAKTAMFKPSESYYSYSAADDFTALSRSHDLYDDMRSTGVKPSPSKQKKLPFAARRGRLGTRAAKLSSSLLRNLSLSILADNYNKIIK